jgi:SAM-dependent methyltransferase
MSETFQQAIDLRYSGLAESSCCLSCGGAVDHGAPREGEVCVDLGSGRGQDVLRMAEAVGPQGMVYGIDTATGMLQKARRTAEKMGVTQVRFLEGELDSLPLPDGHVDLVVSNCTLNHARDKAAVWREIHRVLAPGGRFVVSDIYSLEEVPATYRDDPAAVAECWAGAVTRQAYLDTVLGAGLEDVAIVEESEPYDKGRIRVASFTLRGSKARRRCCG